jgi:secreted Zn-dependent insulinase-like peptidase
MAAHRTIYQDLSHTRPASDNKTYELGVLPCGLEVLLVGTDARRSQAAVAMTVKVGSFYDPENAEVS